MLAEGEARSLRHKLVGTEHLLLGLLADDGTRAAALLREAGTTLAATRRKVAEAVGPGHAGTTDPTSSPRATRAIGRAPRLARDHGADIVGEEHLLLAVLDVEGTAGQVLRGLGVDLEQLRSALGGQATAPEPEPDQPAIVAAPPHCPSCHLALDAGLMATVVPVLAHPSADEIVLLSCPDCGAVVATTPRQ